jgi:hypothetical protein
MRREPATLKDAVHTGTCRVRLPALVAATLMCAGSACADTIGDAWRGTYWGEPASALVRHFGTRARELPRPIDFGDSYADVVLPRLEIGGYAFVVFFQMDKTTRGLKRIQIERNRHGVTPPAFRAILAQLAAEYGTPEAACNIPPGPAGGYQTAAERVWLRNNAVIRAIFRDTTIEEFEGCLAADPSFGPCGLTGQLLVRISPPTADTARCPAR